MSKQTAIFCSKCGRMTRQTYVGRERGGMVKEIVEGILSVGMEPLWKLSFGEKLGGKTFWECAECGHINED